MISLYSCRRLVGPTLSMLVATSLGAQDSVPVLRPDPARNALPIRQISVQAASDTTVVMQVASVRHLPGGSVIVNDTRKRQLVVFEPSLQRARVIADTSSNSPNSYGLRVTGGGLIPYVGDSTLFMDYDSQAFLVIDERGNFARVMAPVRASDLYYIGSSEYGAAGFDAQGRVVYRGVRRSQNIFDMSTPGRSVITEPDSAPVMRMDFDKRTVDTLGFLKLSPQKMVRTVTPGMGYMMPMLNPLPQSDEWALLPDGTVAIVRAADYHVDWLSPQKQITSSPRMPFDWRRLTLEEKKLMVDSVKRQEAERVAKLPPPPPTPPGQPAFPRPTFEVVEATDLPDYFPPVRQGQVRADPLGRVWILPATSKDAKAGLLYDVVDRSGTIVERVQLPKDRTLVGFAPDGALYLNHVISPTRAALERAVVVR